jgi:hypothetical protein
MEFIEKKLNIPWKIFNKLSKILNEKYIILFNSNIYVMKFKTLIITYMNFYSFIYKVQTILILIIWLNF